MFATVTELAEVDPPDESQDAPTGRSLLPVLSGRADRLYDERDAIGYELGGNAALFRGDHKLVLNRPPLGDGQWHLYDIAQDPGETTDLALSHPARFSQMQEDYAAYAAANHVLPVPDGYDQRREVFLKWAKRRFTPYVRPALAIGASLLLLLALGIWRRTRRTSSA